MKQAHETLPLPDIIEVLQTLCSERRTGTMFLHTDTNHSARIGMEQGRIFFVAYGRHRGMDAIEQIKNMQHGKFSFAESIFNSGSEIPLPPTTELLAQLALAAVGDPSVADGTDEPIAAWAKSARPLPLPSAPPTAPPIAFANLPLPGSADDVASNEGELRTTGERLYDRVADALALLIGPVASLVCDDYRDRLVAVSTAGAYRRLAAEIAADAGGPEDAARFLARLLAAAGL
jgi:hypothetical protein